ncbi:hypothetical protein ACRAWG_07085 [Methylobacterium sp. P31]
MSDPEPDAIFRERLLHVVSEELRPSVEKAVGAELDAIGRRYDRFRTGVPLKAFEASGNRPASKLPEGLWNRR